MLPYWQYKRNKPAYLRKMAAIEAAELLRAAAEETPRTVPRCWDAEAEDEDEEDEPAAFDPFCPAAAEDGGDAVTEEAATPVGFPGVWLVEVEVMVVVVAASRVVR